MKKGIKRFVTMLVAIALMIAVNTMSVSASEVTEEGISSGTFGISNGYTWEYDADTKTLLIGGKDEHSTAVVFRDLYYSLDYDIEKVILRECTLVDGYLGGCFAELDKMKNFVCENTDTSQLTDMSFWFDGCSNLVSMDFTGIDTSNVKRFASTFQKCTGLKTIDLSELDTSGAEDMSAMFFACTGLESLDLSNFDTSNVTNMRTMFYRCTNLKSLNIRSFDTSQVTDMDSMLGKCDKLETVYTPDIMAEGQSIELPATFCDPEGNRTTAITPEYCDTVLVRVDNEVAIQAESAELTVGDNLQLSLNINNETQEVSADTDYIWSVESEDVVTVSDTGLVTGIGMGTATISCVHKEDAEKNATYEIAILIPFDDIKISDWQYPFVKYSYQNNLMTGKSETKFDMNGNLTRAEFITVLYSHSRKPDVTYEQQFSDVAEDKWFADAVTWAKQEGIAAGNPNGTFGVADDITREQLVVMLYQYAIKSGMADAEAVTGDLSEYADLNMVSTWAVDALKWGVEEGIIAGKTQDGEKILDPKGSTARGECATMMMRYVELTKE